MENGTKKVLVVDDDPSILFFMEAMLEDAGYRVVTMEKGDGVEPLLADNPPQLIILDMLLSGQDGRDITRKLKQSEQTRHIPIIMVSAHPGAEKTVRAAGADDFLPKPFEMDDLLALVAKHIKQEHH